MSSYFKYIFEDATLEDLNWEYTGLLDEYETATYGWEKKTIEMAMESVLLAMKFRFPSAYSPNDSETRIAIPRDIQFQETSITR